MILSRNTFRSAACAAVACAVLALAPACGGGGSGSGSTSGGAGGTDIMVTDAPSDTWSTVQVQVTSVTLLNQADHTKTAVAFTGAATVNLVDLDSVGELLASAQLPAGTYDQAVITVNPDPTTMSIIPAGGALPAIAASNIFVVGNGSVTVDLSPVLTVTSSGSNALQLDFDLNHPLFINQTASGVVVDFQVRHKPSPVLLGLIQLHRHLGTVSSVNASAGSFVMRTQAGYNLTINTNGSTLFYDADNHPFTIGSLAGMGALDAVMVASRLQDDGSLYAVRVWYCSPGNAAGLPQWSPEGHVISVNTGTDRMVVDNADGNPRTISVNAGTVFTFQNTVAIGTGTAYLADVKRGFKVSVGVTDPLATPLVATSVNIERAVDSGYIDVAGTTATTLVYGQTALANLRSYPYASPFSWWYYEQPTVTNASPSAFAGVLTAVNGVQIAGISDLAWNAPAWDAATAILTPVVLPAAKITQNYASGTGTMQITYTDPVTGPNTTQTILLTAAAGGGQTLVMKVPHAISAAAITPLDPVANWPADLTTASTSVWVSVVPTATGDLAAYSVLVLE
jgi:hypothetical protein